MDVKNKLLKETEEALEEYWNQLVPEGGMRRTHYSQDFILGHKLAYHQLIENRTLTVFILRNVLNLPQQNTKK